MDEQQHRVAMTGEGSEGGGWVRGTMFSQVDPVPDGSEVTVRSELDIAGRALQFGRSLIESIMKQQFQKFAETVTQKLEI
jgi:carbon monoxide dehydrogenase subunit G